MTLSGPKIEKQCCIIFKLFCVDFFSSCRFLITCLYNVVCQYVFWILSICKSFLYLFRYASSIALYKQCIWFVLSFFFIFWVLSSCFSGFPVNLLCFLQSMPPTGRLIHIVNCLEMSELWWKKHWRKKNKWSANQYHSCVWVIMETAFVTGTIVDGCGGHNVVAVVWRKLFHAVETALRVWPWHVNKLVCPVLEGKLFSLYILQINRSLLICWGNAYHILCAFTNATTLQLFVV